jgi:hypothetical protein
MIKSRRMRWEGQVACVGDRRGAYRVSWGNLRGRDHLEDPGVRWEDNIKLYLQEIGPGAWSGLIWLKIGTDCGHL